MNEICDETLRLVQQAADHSELDLSYTIEGMNIRTFYDMHCESTHTFPPLLEHPLNGNVSQGQPELYDPEYYSHTYRLVGTLFQGVIFLIGLLGNLMVVVVVAKTKSMHSPTNCYLVSLAVADIITLLAAVPNEILSYYLIGGKWLYGEVACSLFVFSQNLGINASTLSLTAFTVERYIAICHPMKAQTMCTVSRAKKITGGVWLCSIVYCSPWLVLTSLTKLPYRGVDDVEKCTYKLSREAYTYYYLTDFFVFYVVPLLLSVVLYSLIARILFESQSLKSGNRAATSHSGGGSAKCGGNNGCGPLTVDSTKTNAARVQVVKMLVMVVVIFAVLWLPYRGMLVYNSFATMFGADTFMDLWFLMFVKTCIYINSACNPILYNAMSVKFRRAFSRTLFCGKARSGASFRTGAYGAHYGRAHTTYSTATVVTTPTNLNPGGNRLGMTATDTSTHDSTGTNSTSGTATLLVHTPSKQPMRRQEQATLLQLNTSAQVVVGLRQNHSSRKRNHLNCEESNLDSMLSHGHGHGRLRQGVREESDDRGDKQVVTQL